MTKLWVQKVTKNIAKRLQAFHTLSHSTVSVGCETFVEGTVPEGRTKKSPTSMLTTGAANNAVHSTA